MLDKKLVNVDIHQTEHILYSEAVLFADNDRVKVAIQDQHTNIILIEKMARSFLRKNTMNVRIAIPMIFSNR